MNRKILRLAFECRISEFLGKTCEALSALEESVFTIRKIYYLSNMSMLKEDTIDEFKLRLKQYRRAYKLFSRALISAPRVNETNRPLYEYILDVMDDSLSKLEKEIN